MSIYYYHYETTVHRSFNDPTYDLVEGFLIETPLGILQFFCQDEINVWDSFADFDKSIQEYYPNDFQVIKLRN